MKLGNVILNNIIYGSKENETKGVEGGFKGKIFPINPKAPGISGLKAYPSLADVPEEVDMAVICVPPGVVKSVIEDCGKKGCLSVVVITAGFSEAGEENPPIAEMDINPLMVTKRGAIAVDARIILKQ